MSVTEFDPKLCQGHGQDGTVLLPQGLVCMQWSVGSAWGH